MLGGQVACQLAETAAELENPHTRFQIQFVRHQRQLGALGFVEGVDPPFPAVVGAGVLHGRAEHGLVETIGKIIVLLGHLAGTPTGLLVGELAQQDLEDRRRGADMVFDAGTLDANEKLVEALGVPPAVHVGLAHAERSFGQRTPVEAVVVNFQVPGPIAVDLHIGGLEQFCHFPFR